MKDLIARLEAASEGSRELDAEIMFDLYAKPVGKKPDGGPSGYLWPEDNASWSFGLRFPGKDREWFTKRRRGDKETLLIERDGALVLMNDLRVPRLTTSLDAALTLVPGSHEWSVGVDLENRKGWARVADDIWDECCDDIVSAAPTIPLALCIAALKARSEA